MKTQKTLSELKEAALGELRLAASHVPVDAVNSYISALENVGGFADALRDHFAGLAMSALVNDNVSNYEIAKWAYQMAEEMLRARTRAMLKNGGLEAQGFKEAKPKIVPGRCACTAHRHVSQIGEWDVCPLVDGGHTSFTVLRCDGCGKVCGFPDSNLQIALDQGTAKTKATLRKIMGLTDESEPDPRFGMSPVNQP